MTPTPYYVFNHSVLSSAYAGMCQDFRGMRLYYCLKANGERSIVEALHKAGALFEVSSQGEWDTAISIGAKADETICGVPIKPRSLIRNLYRGGCRYFVFDSLGEYVKLVAEAPDAAKVLRLFIGDIAPGAIPFGARDCEIATWIESGDLDPHAVAGITFDIRKNKDIQVSLRVLDYVEEFLARWPGRELKLVNIGGNYRPSAEVGPEFYEKLFEKISTIGKLYDLEFISENGRSLVKHAGIIYAKVILVRESGDGLDVFIDASVSSGVTHEPTGIRTIHANPTPSQDKVPCNFFGVTCCRTRLFQWVLDFIPREGHILEMTGMGAYTICKTSAFHSLPRPEVFYEL